MTKPEPATIGIDPGFKGAIAVLDMSGGIIRLEPMPILKDGKATVLDEIAIRDILYAPHAPEWYYTVSHVWIEKAQSMPGQGVVGVGRYMAGYGILRGMCVGLQIPYSLVHPATWKKKMLRDMPKGKQASVIRCKQLYPGLVLKRTEDGKADAVLIGRYGVGL